MSGFGKKIVERWNDWQLIVLVLLSLLVQLLLLGTAGLRKHTQPRRWRKIYFWALYVGSKYIITYPLGILSRASTSEPNADIQALWAALLLFHLGGPDDFTALSLEDNKIWHRQCFELSIRALTTAYVFSRYVVDRNFARFIIPFVLISLAGVLKCAEQVFALKEATMEALIKPVLGKPDAGPDYADTMDRVDGMLRSGVLPFMNIDNKRLGRPNTDARQAGGSTAGQNVADTRMANGSTAGQNVADARMANRSTAGQNVADARMTNGLTAGQNAADARMANGPTTSQNAAEMTQQGKKARNGLCVIRKCEISPVAILNLKIAPRRSRQPTRVEGRGPDPRARRPGRGPTRRTESRPRGAMHHCCSTVHHCWAL